MNSTGNIGKGSISARFGVVALFATAMGLLEAIVVVYLRALYYPGGFAFPLAPMAPPIYRAELVREVATLVMLGAVAWLAGRNRLQRLGAFLFTFAVWDIIYYVALKIFLNWPASLLTWDILFLIPVTWMGPVLAPVINSLTMIAMALLWYTLDRRHPPLSLRPAEWLLTLSGALLIFFTYVRDFTLLILQSRNPVSAGNPATAQQITLTLSHYIPEQFLWGIFTAGELLILTAMTLTWWRVNHKQKLITQNKKAFITSGLPPDLRNLFETPPKQ